jgi:NTP pyrophosphatase (non-canonical NTP hydrolase)
MNNIDLNTYKDFVAAVTSNESNDFDSFINRLQELNQTGVNIALLLTSAIGLSSESGEYSELVKKTVFQSKPLSDDTIHHMQSELSDILWYWINGCRALNIDPYEIINWNIKKLESRYPGGKFDAYHSENRKEGDI